MGLPGTTYTQSKGGLQMNSFSRDHMNVNVEPEREKDKGLHNACVNFTEIRAGQVLMQH